MVKSVHNMKHGFTLIEIIIIIAILLFSSNLAFSFYHQYINETELKAEVNKIIDVIDLAKKKSISSEISQNISCENFNGYYVSFLTNKNYSIGVCCDSSCSGDSIILNNFSLKNNIVFTNYPSDIIIFSPITGELKENFTISLIVKHLLINNCYQILINKQGIINNSKISCN